MINGYKDESRNENNGTEELTVERLKKFEGLEDINYDKAMEILKSFDTLSYILYDCFQKQILEI